MAVILVEYNLCSNETYDRLGLWVIPIKFTGETKSSTWDFLLDTGTERTVVSPDIQSLIDINVADKYIRGSGVGGSSSYKLGEVDNVEIGSIVLGQCEILIGNLPSPFDKYNIVGLLGSDIFKSKSLCLELDYLKCNLRITRQIVLPSE